MSAPKRVPRRGTLFPRHDTWKRDVSVTVTPNLTHSEGVTSPLSTTRTEVPEDDQPQKKTKSGRPRGSGGEKSLLM